MTGTDYVASAEDVIAAYQDGGPSSCDVVDEVRRAAKLAVLVEQELLVLRCRGCQKRDADFIVWGGLFPKTAVGPRCYDCAATSIGHATLRSIEHAAIIDLTKLRRAQKDPPL